MLKRLNLDVTDDELRDLKIRAANENTTMSDLVRAELGLNSRRNKIQITITINPDLLNSIDAIASKKGLSRASMISVACSNLVEAQHATTGK